jgi:hypothetical protein
MTHLNNNEILLIKSSISFIIQQEYPYHDYKDYPKRNINLLYVDGVRYHDKYGQKFNHWIIEVGDYYYYFSIDNNGCTILKRDFMENLNDCKIHNKLIVGLTPYSHTEISFIFNQLIISFNNTETIFNNCKLFTNMLLSFATGSHVEIDDLILYNGFLFDFNCIDNINSLKSNYKKKCIII